MCQDTFRCSTNFDPTDVLLFLIGIGISIAVLSCIGVSEKGPMVLVCIFLSIFFLFIVTAGFVEFYTSIKVLAYVHTLTDPSHGWKSQDKVECRLKEITEYLIREGKK